MRQCVLWLWKHLEHKQTIDTMGHHDDSPKKTTNPFIDGFTTPFTVNIGYWSLMAYALCCSRRNLSLSMAMNSPLVGLSSLVATLQPKALFRVSMRPRLQATSMAWRMARSTLLAEVLKRLPMPEDEKQD